MMTDSECGPGRAAHRLGIGVQEGQQGEPWNVNRELFVSLDGRAFTSGVIGSRLPASNLRSARVARRHCHRSAEVVDVDIAFSSLCEDEVYAPPNVRFRVLRDQLPE